MISVVEAERIIRSRTKDFGMVSCPLSEAHGRVLREPIRADRDYPPFDRATVDGIAIANPHARMFRVEYTLQAGRPSRRLKDPASGCIRIMTGAVVPSGIVRVVPVEFLAFDKNFVRITEGAPEGPNIHRRGSDAKKGAVLLRPGCLLTGPRIAVIASTGRKSLRVARVPSVAVISTGDELVDVGRPAKPWQIRKSNAYAMRATLQRCGIAEVGVFHVKDKRAAVAAVFTKALRDYDVVIATGGVSMGDYDFVPGVLRELRIRMLFHKVAQRPGKPLWFGVSRRGQPVFALPGNPVSSLVCLHRYTLPCLGCVPEPAVAVLAKPVEPHPTLTRFLPVRAKQDAGRIVAIPERYGGSGDLVALSESDGFIEVPASRRKLQAGANADFRAWI